MQSSWEVERVSHDLWPTLPVIPTMSTGATDGVYLRNAGIPTYGVSGMFNVADSGSHGLNERLRVDALYEGQEFLYRLTKALASGGGASILYPQPVWQTAAGEDQTPCRAIVRHDR